MIFEYKIKNKERIIVLKEEGIIKAKSVLIYGCDHSIKGKILCVLKSIKNLYGFVILKENRKSMKVLYISDFKYLNWQTANKEGIKKLKSTKA